MKLNMEKRFEINKVLALLIIMGVLATVVIEPVLAANKIEMKNEMEEVVRVGNRFENSAGNVEIVVRVNKDGSFVTEEMGNSDHCNQNKIKRKNCSHPASQLVATSEDPIKEIRTVGTASCCFKYRLVIYNKCKQCGRNRIKTYGAWKRFAKHSYPIFGRVCKNCGYKK